MFVLQPPSRINHKVVTSCLPIVARCITTLVVACRRVLLGPIPNHIMLLACFCPAASTPFGLKGPLSVRASAAGDRLQLLLHYASASADGQPLAKGQYHQDILPLILKLERESDILSGAVVVDPKPKHKPKPNPNPNPEPRSL